MEIFAEEEAREGVIDRTQIAENEKNEQREAAVYILGLDSCFTIKFSFFIF